MRLLRDLLSAHEAFRGPSGGLPRGLPRAGVPLAVPLLPLPSLYHPTHLLYHPVHPPYQHHPARIEKDFDGRWLEGEARDRAEEVVGAVRCPVPALRLECPLAYQEGW